VSPQKRFSEVNRLQLSKARDCRQTWDRLGLRRRSSPSATADLRSSETVQRIHASSGHHPEPRSRRGTARCTWSTRSHGALLSGPRDLAGHDPHARKPPQHRRRHILGIGSNPPLLLTLRSDDIELTPFPQAASRTRAPKNKLKPRCLSVMLTPASMLLARVSHDVVIVCRDSPCPWNLNIEWPIECPIECPCDPLPGIARRRPS
jgi:hypothetical protein